MDNKTYRKAVFLDRDGVINRETGDINTYITSADQIEILPGVAKALIVLRDAGFLLIVISNQSAIARGLLSIAGFFSIQREIDKRLAIQEARLDAVYFCPHHPKIGEPPLQKECTCRKPAPGMLVRAMNEWNIRPNESWMVGDSICDFQAARAAGVRPLSVGEKWDRVLRFVGLPEAVKYIISRSGDGNQ